MALLLHVCLSALAGGDSFSIAPWSGANLTVDSGGTTANVSLSAPLGRSAERTFGLHAAAPILAPPIGNGTYEAGASLRLSNSLDGRVAFADAVLVSSLPEAANRMCVLASASGGSPSGFSASDVDLTLDRVKQLLETWSQNVPSEPPSCALMVMADTDAAAAGSASDRSAAPSAAVTTTEAQELREDWERSARAVKAALEGLVPELEREKAVSEITTGTSPFDEIAARNLKERFSVFSIETSYKWETVADTANATSLGPQSIDAGVGVASYGARGLVLVVDAGAAPRWSATGQAAVGGFAEVGLALVSQPLVKLARTDAEVVEERAKRDARRKAKAQMKPIDRRVAPDNPDATAADDVSGLYGVLQVRWREDVEAGELTGGGEVVVGLRPTSEGAALLLGVSATQTPDAFTVLPMLSFAGDFPELGKR